MYGTIDAFHKSITINFEILAQVYKIRPEIASGATSIYDMPKAIQEEKQFDILDVAKKPISAEMKEKQRKDQYIMQQIAQLMEENDRQNNYI